MYVWRFRQFGTRTGRKVIDDWRRKLSPGRQAALDLFLDRIAKMQSWTPGICSKLRNHPGCWELRWTGEKVEHRIFGFYGAAREFNMLVGCTHKGKVYDPPGAFDTLDARKKQIEDGTGGLYGYTIWSDPSDEEDDE